MKKSLFIMVNFLIFYGLTTVNSLNAQSHLNKFQIRGTKVFLNGQKANDKTIESLILSQNNPEVISKFNEYKKDRNTGQIIGYAGLGITALGAIKLLTMGTDKFGFIDESELKKNALISLGGLAVELIGFSMVRKARKTKALPAIEMYNLNIDNTSTDMSYELVPTISENGIGLSIRF